MVDVSLFGMKPAGFHLENLLFHAVTVLLLFQGLYGATHRLWPSAIVAALFGLHPINVESVAWITERKNVLCAFFWVLSVNAYFNYAATARKRNYASALVWFAFALMSKPMAVTLPGVLFLIDFWPLQRDLSQWRRVVAEKIPFIVLSAATCILATLAPHDRDAWVTSADLSFGARLSNALVSYGLYLRDFVWPANLAAFYPHPFYPQPLLAGISFAVLLAITIVAGRLYRSRPYLIVGWLWFLGVLVPMLGLIQVGSQARGDRFTYLAQVGIFVALVWWVADLCTERRMHLMVSIMVVVLMALAAQTSAEVRYWSNTVTLFERAIEQTGPNVCARAVAGRALVRQGEDSRASEHFAVALHIQPQHHDIWYDYGLALDRLGRKADAVRALATAVRLASDELKYRYALASTLDEIGSTDGAIAQYRELLRREPRAVQAHEALGRLLKNKGLYDEAQHHLQEAAKLRSHKDLSSAVIGSESTQSSQKQLQPSPAI